MITLCTLCRNPRALHLSPELSLSLSHSCKCGLQLVKLSAALPRVYMRAHAVCTRRASARVGARRRRTRRVNTTSAGIKSVRPLCTRAPPYYVLFLLCRLVSTCALLHFRAPHNVFARARAPHYAACNYCARRHFN